VNFCAQVGNQLDGLVCQLQSLQANAYIDQSSSMSASNVGLHENIVQEGDVLTEPAGYYETFAEQTPSTQLASAFEQRMETVEADELLDDTTMSDGDCSVDDVQEDCFINHVDHSYTIRNADAQEFMLYKSAHDGYPTQSTEKNATY
jgi:hypothetical protein